MHRPHQYTNDKQRRCEESTRWGLTKSMAQAGKLCERRDLRLCKYANLQSSTVC